MGGEQLPRALPFSSSLTLPKPSAHAAHPECGKLPLEWSGEILSRRETGYRGASGVHFALRSLAGFDQFAQPDTRGAEKGFFGRRARVAQLDGSGRTFAFQ
jgi:hypothetical protein